MNLPPLSPDAVTAKSLAWLKIPGQWNFSKKAIDYCLLHVELNYVHECLIEHFKSKRKVFQKPKDDGSGLQLNTVMQLNLELPLAEKTDVYAWLVLNQFELTICNLHKHYTVPLPR